MVLPSALCFVVISVTCQKNNQLSSKYELGEMTAIIGLNLSVDAVFLFLGCGMRRLLKTFLAFTLLRFVPRHT